MVKPCDSAGTVVSPATQPCGDQAHRTHVRMGVVPSPLPGALRSHFPVRFEDGGWLLSREGPMALGPPLLPHPGPQGGGWPWGPAVTG